MNKKIIGIIVAVVVVFSAAYFISKQSSKDTSPSQTSTGTPKPQTSGTTLDLSGQQLTSFPESVLSRTDVTVLNLSNNQLTTLPARIAKMTNLEVLNVENNRLESLPVELEDMIFLRQLDISNNRLPIDLQQRIKAKLTETEVKI